MCDRKWKLLAVVVVVLAVGLSAQARPVPSAKEADQALFVVQPGQIAGTVVQSDGRTPVVKATVRVWSVEKNEFVFEAVTDEGGAYTLPSLPEGRYVAIFGDRVRVELVVDKTKGMAASPLKVLVPRGASQLTRRQIATELRRVGSVYAAGSAPQALPVVGKLTLLKTALIMAGAGATAVGVYEATDDDSSSHRRTVVSP